MTIFSKKKLIENSDYKFSKNKKELDVVYSNVVNSLNDIQPHINFIKNNCFKKIYNNKKICKYILELAEHDEQVKQCYLTIYDKINSIGFSIFLKDNKELPPDLYFINDFAKEFSSFILSIAIKSTLYGTQSVELSYNTDSFIYVPKKIKLLDFDLIKEDEKGLFFFKNNFSEEEANKVRLNEKVYARFISMDLHLNSNGDGLIYDIAPLAIIRQGLIGTYEKLANNFSYPSQVLKVNSPAQVLDNGKMKGDYYLNILQNTGSKNYVFDEKDMYNVFNYNINHNVVKDLLEYVDKSISKIILGQNLSSDVQSGSYAAAQVHQDTLNLKIESMAKYTNLVISHILNMILSANGIQQEVTFKYNNISYIKNEEAKTYAILAKDAGVSFTKEAIKKLGFSDEDIESIEPKNTTIKNSSNLEKNYFLKSSKEIINNEKIEKQQKEIDELADFAMDEHQFNFNKNLSEVIEKSKNQDELLANMVILVKSMNADDFSQISDALITADIAGYVYENETQSK